MTDRVQFEALGAQGIAAQRLVDEHDVAGARGLLLEGVASALATRRSTDAVQYWAMFRQLGGGPVGTACETVLADCADELLPAVTSTLRAVAYMQPTNAIAQCLLGFLCRRMQRPAEAVKRFRQALRLCPQFPSARYGLGVLLAELGDAERSNRELQLALLDRPAYADCLVALARNLETSGEYVTAAKCYAAAAAADLSHVAAHFGCARSLLRRRTYQAGWHALHTAWALRGGRPTDLSPDTCALAATGSLLDDLFLLRFVARMAPPLRRLRLALSPSLFELLAGRTQWPASADLDTATTGEPWWPTLAALPLLATPESAAVIPAAVPLEVPQAARSAVRASLVGQRGPWLGLCWRGAGGKRGPRYSMPPLRRLALAVSAWPGTLVVLQADAQPHELALLRRGVSGAIAPYQPDLSTPQRLAALLAELQECVTVDAVQAELRAGLGLNCRVLAGFDADWRLADGGAGADCHPAASFYRPLPRHGWVDALDGLRRDLQYAALAPERLP